MTAINTNTAALNAQYYLKKTNQEMESAMARLSSGSKVNSAADDAAGLAIAGRMTSQLKGLDMAIKNANDTISMAQTAEGAMEEVTNMLQRIRELAVQSANGTMNASDRASLDAEVQSLKAEIDRVANTTTFNSQNLLDGSFNGTFQIGDKGGQTVDVKIGSVLTKSLGMGGGAAGTDTVIGGRRAASAAIAAGDIRINGQDLAEFATTDDMEDILKNINTNVDNVTATAFNVVVAATIGDGVTSGDGVGGGTGMVLTTTELGAQAATTFQISASSSLTELRDNINAETGGVIAASINDDGKLVLSNETGADIIVEDDSTSTGSGFSNAATTYRGFVKVESTDGSPVRIETGNAALAAPGTAADVAKLGFNVTYQQDDADGYTTKGTALTAPATEWNKGDIKINGVEMYNEDITTDSFKGKIDLVNSFSATTGVTASASFSQTFSMTASNIVEGDIYEINGTKITVGNTTTVAGVAALINAKSDEIGLKATVNGSNLTLAGDNVQSLTINNQTTTEKTDALTSTISAVGATSAARTIDILDADVKEGRTFSLALSGGATGATVRGTFTYTAQSGDDAEDVVNGWRDAMRVDTGATAYDAASSAGLSTATNGSNGFELRFAAALAAGDLVAAFSRTDDNKMFGAISTSGTAVTSYASLKLDSIDNQPIKIDIGQNEADAAATHGFIEANVGAADFDVNEPTLSAGGGNSMSGLSVGTASTATAALKTLDNAIDSVNSIRGDLGAVQNRLSYTVNNLSSISNATAGAKGRIMDADFAKETSELTKNQILSQAATSMLAQANQSKQGVLALLQ